MGRTPRLHFPFLVQGWEGSDGSQWVPSPFSWAVQAHLIIDSAADFRVSGSRGCFGFQSFDPQKERQWLGEFLWHFTSAYPCRGSDNQAYEIGVLGQTWPWRCRLVDQRCFQ